jgi:uncharacterized protein
VIYTLVVLSDTFAVSRLAPHEPIPDWATGGELFAITRTREELSIVCRQDDVPDDVTSERNWRCLRVAGELDFAQVGVLVSILRPLAEAAIPAFAVSTYLTDYVLVKAVVLERAVKALQAAGHHVILHQVPQPP